VLAMLFIGSAVGEKRAGGRNEGEKP
jgi:hypothetical protein